MEDFISIMKALSDRHRVIALMALCDGELCVCQIVKLLGLAPSTVSTHMTILKQTGLVEARKDSRWVYYKLSDKIRNPLGFKILEFTRQLLEKDPQIDTLMEKLVTIKSEITESCTL